MCFIYGVRLLKLIEVAHCIRMNEWLADISRVSLCALTYLLLHCSMSGLKGRAFATSSSHPPPPPISNISRDINITLVKKQSTVYVFQFLSHFFFGVTIHSFSTLNYNLAIACGKVLSVSAYTSHVELKFPVLWKRLFADSTILNLISSFLLSQTLLHLSQR